jgi:hypothetical protein
MNLYYESNLNFFLINYYASNLKFQLIGSLILLKKSIYLKKII